VSDSEKKFSSFSKVLQSGLKKVQEKTGLNVPSLDIFTKNDPLPDEPNSDEQREPKTEQRAPQQKFHDTPPPPNASGKPSVDLKPSMEGEPISKPASGTGAELKTHNKHFFIPGTPESSKVAPNPKPSSTGGGTAHQREISGIRRAISEYKKREKPNKIPYGYSARYQGLAPPKIKAYQKTSSFAFWLKYFLFCSFFVGITVAYKHRYTILNESEFLRGIVKKVQLMQSAKPRTSRPKVRAKRGKSIESDDSEKKARKIGKDR
jgi:hypothetical protein